PLDPGDSAQDDPEADAPVGPSLKRQSPRRSAPPSPPPGPADPESVECPVPSPVIAENPEEHPSSSLVPADTRPRPVSERSGPFNPVPNAGRRARDADSALRL